MMANNCFWKDLQSIQFKVNVRFVKLCHCSDDLVIALSVGNIIYMCNVVEDEIKLKEIPDVLGIDIACKDGSVFIVDVHGKILRIHHDNINQIKEIKVHDDPLICPHGVNKLRTTVLFKNITAGEFGILAISVNGQLWGCGCMPQISIDSSDAFKKVLFFEGRTIHSASLGKNYAAVIARKQIKSSGNDDTDSENEEEVFSSNCSECRQKSPSISLSETCPLGLQIRKSSGDDDVNYDINSINASSTASSDDVKNQPGEEQNNNKGDNQLNDETVENADKIEAAKLFLSKQLSWVSVSEDYLVEYTENSTRIIKENVSNLTNFVFEGVKTVGDRVVNLSRHVSNGSDANELDEMITNRNSNEEFNALYCSFETNFKIDECNYANSISSNNSNQTTSCKVDNLVKVGRNILNTELWTWGDISHGQLGLGDTVTRKKPMMVTNLSGLGLQKVCCGNHHCAVLTLDGRLFLWGKNNFHQVAYDSREDKCGPVRFLVDSDIDRVRDIDASDDHTIFYGLNKHVYYLGKYNSTFTQQLECLANDHEQHITSTDDIIMKDNSKQRCYHWQISTTRYLSYCHYDDKNIDILDAISICQQKLEHFIVIYQNTIKPFFKKSKSIPMHNNLYENVCEHYEKLVNLTALDNISLWQYAENHIKIHEIPLIKNSSEYIHVYKGYITKICHIIAISGFSEILKITDVSSKVVKLISTLDSETDKKNEIIMSSAFLYPLDTIKSYKSILQCIQKNIKTDEDKKSIDNVLQSLNGIIEQYEKSKKDAEITRLFWETTGKVLAQHKTPEKRLIRESRSRPLALMHAGRFSNHWFILFNDVLLHINNSSESIHPLETIWVEPVANNENNQNVIHLVTPEETISVFTLTAQEKTEWIHAFQAAINMSLNKSNSFKTPSVRSASYTFTNKNQFYKDAKYQGRWLDGKLHGHGKVEWPDGKVYAGEFQFNYIQGTGKMDIPGIGLYEGEWKENLQCGYGIMKYNNGDIYEGYFKDGLAHGHGYRVEGNFNKVNATVYLGEWVKGVRHGYGVIDDIGRGEKYLGNWTDNRKHGCGLIVSLDGMYYEGMFMQDVLTGHGMMIFEDGTHYEGEFKSSGVLTGRGVLTMPNGAKIEGNLTGTWSDGIKLNNSTLKFSTSSTDLSRPSSFGKLCVAPNQKWNSLFNVCYKSLGIPETLLTPMGKHFERGTKVVDNKRVWHRVAVSISNSLKDTSKKGAYFSRISPCRDLETSNDHLELIPQFGQQSLDIDSYLEVKDYVQKACESQHHPLGILIMSLSNAFNTTYGGVRVHPLLLSHAVLELKSITLRVFEIVRVLFPALPNDGVNLVLAYKKDGETQEDEENSPADGEVVSAAALLQPTLLPRVHPSIFVLYALHNKKEDDLYWERLMNWNKHPDLTIMMFLGIHSKFCKQDQKHNEQDSKLNMSCYSGVIETLQQVKTTFSPIEKLLVIRNTFKQMTDIVRRDLGDDYLWTMDELFPVFLFIVVRAQILQLGSEIQFIEEFLEPCMQHGELGIILTTLKACYFQILQEKMYIHSY